MDNDVVLKPGRFNPPAKGTCRECPLRKDSQRGRLGGWSVLLYLEAMLRTPADIACHLSKGFDEQDMTQMRSCTGVANFRANLGVVHRMLNGNARDAAMMAGENPVDVFETATEFYRHHQPGRGEKIR